MNWFYCKNWWLAHRSAKPSEEEILEISVRNASNPCGQSRSQGHRPSLPVMWLSLFFWKGGCDSIVTLFLFDFCVLIPGWNSLITFIFRGGGNEGENPKCLWWFLLVQKLNEIKFIPGLFFSSNYPKDLQYKLSECLGFFCLFFFTQNKNAT